jgi:outer membrane protein OmpA-like peptidoglycan-associated protein/outer membrane protein assembly factor BamD (BamD/ComL family)
MMKKTLHTIFFCLIVGVSSSVNSALGQSVQKAQRLYNSALSDVQTHQYARAITQLQQAIDEYPNYVEAMFLMSDAYAELGDYQSQAQILEKAIQINPNTYLKSRVVIAKAYQQLMKYDEAIAHINKYLENTNLSESDKQQAQWLKSCCLFGQWALAHPVAFSPERMSDSVNSPDFEYWPSLSADGQTLVFTRQVPMTSQYAGYRKNPMQEELFQSQLVNGVWTKAVNLGEPLNTPDNEGAQTLSADGRIMAYTACGRRNGLGHCDIYFSFKHGQEWSRPINTGAPLNSPSQETQPSLSADAHTIYYASNRAGAKGSLDIWVANLQSDSTWSEPVNLGDSINTIGNEQSPFIHPDGKTLYFSSDYWPGMGGFDIFMSKRKPDGTWSTPVNLGYPINTPGDEIGLIVSADASMAIYSSDRIPENGKDLYVFTLPKELKPNQVSYLKGIITDAYSHDFVKANFELIDIQTKKTMFKSSSDPVDGSFLVCLPMGSEYALNVSKNGYLFYSEHFKFDEQGSFFKPVVKNIQLSPLREGEKITLENIFFATNSATLDPRSQVELDKIVQFMNQNSLLIVEIQGHTDNTGSKVYNLQLSQQRAASVVAYLTSKGIDAKRLIAKGYGETVPVGDNTKEDGRALNRRIEFKILKIK